MARTYRCRHTCPPGWEVRDDNETYFKNGFRTNAERWEARAASRRESKEAGEAWWMWSHHYYHFEEDPKPPKFRRNYLNRERKAERKVEYRSYRHWMKNLIQREKYDKIVNYTRTGGWLTW